MGLTESILKQIEDLGYITDEVKEGETLVMVAQPATGERQMVRIDGADEDSRYLAACQLAIQCGIDLEG